MQLVRDGCRAVHSVVFKVHGRLPGLPIPATDPKPPDDVRNLNSGFLPSVAIRKSDPRKITLAVHQPAERTKPEVRHS